MIFEGLEGLMCDLDGVVYRGDEAIPGAAETISRLRETGVHVVFCTNNSRSTVSRYVDLLGGLGIEADRDDILTSGVVTAEVLKEEGFAGSSALVVGGPGVVEALSEVGIEVIEDPEETSADVVVVGWDPHFTYEAMRRAAIAVRSGATFVATNSDASFPAPGGVLWPGAGAILASIEVAGGRRAEVMGKPHAPMMEAARKRFGDARSIAVVGDRPDTDLAGARSMGWKTILVLSGVTAKEDAERVDPRPDLVIDSIAGLLEERTPQ